MYNENDGLESNSNYDKYRKCVERIKARTARQEERSRKINADIEACGGSYVSYIFKHNVPSHTDNNDTCGRKDYTAREIAEVLLGSITY